MTEIALIPPHSLLAYTKGRKLQMLLPSCMGVPVYERAYKPSNNRGYTVLDNGMFEKDRPITTQGLLAIASGYQVNEIILPDVRDDSYETYQLIRQFLDNYKPFPDIIEDNKGEMRFGPTPKFMAVIQGKTLAEQQDLVISLDGFLPEGTVLGFPRRLTELIGPGARIDIMEFVASKFGQRFKMHMLGIARPWPGDFLRARRQFGDLLRGIDTDAPFVWAAARQELRGLWTPDTERPKDYFDMPAAAFPTGMLHQNIRTLEAWAEGLTT